MKKTIEWLQGLPDGYRERAVAQFQPLNEQSRSMANAISNMCLWSKTKEGGQFWLDVSRHYSVGNQLPPLPDEPLPYTPSTLPTLEEIKEVLWQCAKTEVSEGGATITRMFDKEAAAILELIKSKQ